MPLSFTPAFGSTAARAADSARTRALPADGAHRLWRVVLLALGMLVPLNLPFSVPPLGSDARPGWFTTSMSDVRGVEGGPIIMTRVSRNARSAGVLPGDRLRAIDGVAADASTLRRRESTLRANDTVALLLERGRVLRTVEVIVEAPTVSYRTYTAYVVSLAYFCWLAGMAVIAWRGHETGALLFGAALLLVPPVGFAGGVPGDGALLRVVRGLWQLEATAFRFTVPALLLHALVLTRRRGTSAMPWVVLYAALGVLVLVITRFGSDLLAWTQPGPARTVRMLTGFVLELSCVGVAIGILRRRDGPREVTQRTLVAAVAVAMASAALYSGTRVAFGSWIGEAFVSGLNSVAMFALPAAVAIHYLWPTHSTPLAPRLGRWTAGGVSVGIAGAHALVIAASVAVVLNGSGQDLGGVEWLLFVTVVAASVLPVPAFRWLRTVADRRLVAHWVRVEEDAQTFLAEVSGELDPERIASRVAEELPKLLDVTAAALRPMDAAVGDGMHPVPVLGPDRQPIALLHLGPQGDGRPLDPPTRVLVTTICQGLGAALTAARAADAMRRYEAELAHAERIAALGALTGGLAHEIKNPLAGLKMAVHMLRRDGADVRRLQRIEQDVRRIDDVVSGLLRLANDTGDVPGVSDTGTVDLNELLRASVGDLRHGAEDRGIHLVETYPEPPVLMTGPALPYRLIALNLLTNAIESVSTGGVVQVQLDQRPDAVVLSVRDDGPGVPDAVRPRIFDLHFTTKRHGTGIGLALVRHEAERLGGHAMLVETSSAGTTMRVELPRVARATPFAAHRAP